jgi:UDP-N-acetylglucosamine:LPS N-acetylglucosamine transferase
MIISSFNIVSCDYTDVTLSFKDKYFKLTTKLKKTVLIAPLNWGLGHATRCIPIINALLQAKVEVIIASDGTALELLKKEFPELTHLELPAYNVTYRTSNMVWNIGTQVFKISWAMTQEWFVLRRLIKQYKIDAVISDNRFGCWSKQVPTVFMTHQINIKIPNRFLQFFANRFNHFSLGLFNEVWVPDMENEPNLAGELAHKHSLSKVKYIGILSRMKPLKVEKKYDIGIVLSGPEPQRTYLQTLLLDQIRDFHQKVDSTVRFLFIKGKTNLEEYSETANIEIHGYLTSKSLNQKMSACDLLIVRSGYSTLMDLAKLNKKAVLIPTPGQTEQEYLAEHFRQQGVFDFQNQNHFSLEKAIATANNFTGFKVNMKNDVLLEKTILDLISVI